MGHAAEGEDLAQESLASLVRFWKSHGPPDSPAAFVYLVARRQAGRFRRRWKRLLPLESLDPPSEDAANPESNAIERQRVAQALSLLNRLPRRQREALLIALDKDIPVTNAARALRISVSAFKMRVCRARRCLRQQL
jgi:RNA polymerase sigma factor (sigma-70 family)